MRPYGARWYDPALGRFVQPDTIVPEPGDPQSWNRYSYVRNRPLVATDPSGHRDCGEFCDEAEMGDTSDTDPPSALPEEPQYYARYSPDTALPVGPGPGVRISSDFADPRTTSGGRRYYHAGVDIAASSGDPVYATHPGRVVVVEWDAEGYGRYIVIEHFDLITGTYFYTLYAHLGRNSATVNVGQAVGAGTLIAEVGATGSARGAHLHYEVRTAAAMNAGASAIIGNIGKPGLNVLARYYLPPPWVLPDLWSAYPLTPGDVPSVIPDWVDAYYLDQGW